MSIPPGYADTAAALAEAREEIARLKAENDQMLGIASDLRAALASAPEGEKPALFQRGDFTLHSGARSAWKIECDALTDADWSGLAAMISERCDFGEAVGVPTGGLKLAAALSKYLTRGAPRLVVDDVLTTGKNITEMMQPGDIGWVVFARGPLPENVHALFSMVPAEPTIPLAEALRVARELTAKWGKASGSKYEEGVQDHGARIIAKLEALTGKEPAEPESERDKILRRFDEDYPKPNALDIIEYTERYPLYAEDIRAHIARKEVVPILDVPGNTVLIPVADAVTAEFPLPNGDLATDEAAIGQQSTKPRAESIMGSRAATD